MTNLPPPQNQPASKTSNFCPNCHSPLLGQFCHQCGGNRSGSQPISTMCWNCGEQLKGQFCTSCGSDSINRPIALVDEQQASMQGAISGALFGAVLSGKEHRLQNTAFGAIWGSSSAKTNAQNINAAFAAGAPISAITKYRRRSFAYFVAMFIGWSGLMFLIASAAYPGAVILSAPITWYGCKWLAHTSIWYREPLHACGVTKPLFKNWQQGNILEEKNRIIKRYKIYAIVLILTQLMMMGTSV
jgi:hypothetical protein